MYDEAPHILLLMNKAEFAQATIAGLRLPAPDQLDKYVTVEEYCMPYGFPGDFSERAHSGSPQLSESLSAHVTRFIYSMARSLAITVMGDRTLHVHICVQKAKSMTRS